MTLDEFDKAIVRAWSKLTAEGKDASLVCVFNAVKGSPGVVLFEAVERRMQALHFRGQIPNEAVGA